MLSAAPASVDSAGVAHLRLAKASYAMNILTRNGPVIVIGKRH